MQHFKFVCNIFYFTCNRGLSSDIASTQIFTFHLFFKLRSVGQDRLHVRDGVIWSASWRPNNERLSVDQVGRTLHCLRLDGPHTQCFWPPTQPPTVRTRWTRRPGDSRQGRSQEFATGGGIWGRKSLSGVQGRSPGGNLGEKLPEAGDTCWIFDWTKP